MFKANAPNTYKEDFRIEIDRIFRDFLDDCDMEEYEFPSDYSSPKRKYVHERCRKLGLKSKSRGKEPNRILTVYKLRRSRVAGSSYRLNLSRTSTDIVNTYVARNSHVIFQQVDPTVSVKCENAVGKLIFGNPVLVEPVYSNKFSRFQQTLPTYQLKGEIMQAIEQGRIIIVSAETGSGKTTQIPQYIMENATNTQKPCRIICTQPRRISTVAIAERVSTERGESIGHAVGYQIKLESRLGPKTALVYCTTGVLLRTLMTNVNSLNYITHLIIDEIHERDKFTDFLLIYLKANLPNFKHLKLILMSATMDIDLFMEYFNNEPTVMSIPGRGFTITELFLDETLPLINYRSNTMEDVIRGNSCNIELDTFDTNLLKEMDNTLLQCINFGRDDDFAQLLQLIVTDKVPVNYSDLCFGYTPLIVAAAKGKKDIVEQFLQMGADVILKCKSGYDATSYANSFDYKDIVELLQWYVQDKRKEILSSDLTEIYDKTVSDDAIDHDLIVAIIAYIIDSVNNKDAILIFLPGYDDIISCYDKIYNSKINKEKIKVCILHGGMHISAQHDVFNKCSRKQKIILSTNVAETSITIDDVVFVINSGKVKEKTYESIGGTSSLVTKWASAACVRQRAGRAGRVRPGLCFHMFSRKRFESLPINTIPEILRVPLHELCLQTKLLAPDGTSIEEFLMQAIEQPAKKSISTAISGLITLGALDRDENLTRLGAHLLQLSIEPHLGKMLIYSVIFKCIDPVLTIVATLAHKDPFILPSIGFEKGQANAKRKSLSFGSLSDHMALLKVFQMWQKSKQQKRERQFCQDYFISYAAMEMIMVTRNHLLGQLRACGFVPSNGRDSMQELSRYAEHWPLVKATLAAGLYPNVAFPGGDRFQTMTENKVIMHTSSSLRNVAMNQDLWVTFEEISKLGTICNIKNVTAITPASVILCCGSSLNFDEDIGILTIDEKLNVELDSPAIYRFRTLLDNVIFRKIRNPRLKFSRNDEQLLEAFDNILSAEDSSKDLIHPSGVGDRPLFVYPKMTEYVPHDEMHRDDGYSNHSGTTQNFERNTYQIDSQHSIIRNGRHPYRPVPQDRHDRGNNCGGRPNQKNNNQTATFTGGSNGNKNHYNNYNAARKSNFTDAGAPVLINAIAPKNITIPVTARFFVIRPTEIRNIIISVSQGTWNFSPQTEKKIFRLFMDGFFIMLLFTVRGTNYFQGVARLVNTNEGQPNVPCPIEWLGTNSVSYDQIRHLVHPKVHMVEDGFELEQHVGCDISYKLMASPVLPDNNFRPILGGCSRS